MPAPFDPTGPSVSAQRSAAGALSDASAVVPNGILLVDKPSGPTSHDVVARVRRAAGTRKVGHAGTLDPMATGLLVLGLGPATRLLTHLVGIDKVYLATIRLGQATTTDDAEGEPVGPFIAATAIAQEAVLAAIARLTGPIEQVPSSVSAIKVDGQRSYARVRAGEEVVLPARPVIVSEFRVVERRDARDQPGALDLDVVVACSSGTYVRALARDLGTALGVGGHLTALRRTRVGPFDIAESTRLQDIASADDALAPADVARRLFPSVDVDAVDAIALGHGKRIPLPAAPLGGPIAAIGPDGALVALLTVGSEHIGQVLTGFPDPRLSGGAS